MFICLSMTVFAQNGLLTQETVQATQTETPVQVRNTIPSTITGLERAVLRFRNEDKLLTMRQSTEKINGRVMEKLNKMKNLVVEEIDGKFQVSGVGTARLFGLFQFNREYRYELSEEGTLTRIKREQWFDRFVVEQSPA